MRTLPLVVIAASCLGAFVVRESACAQEPQSSRDEALRLIEQLASPNEAPTERRGPDLKYPSGYERKKQAKVHEARHALKALGPSAFEALIEKWGDERYCLTYSVGINGYMENASVGRICRTIVYDQLQPYGLWPLTDDDPRGRAKRPMYPAKFLRNQKAAREWLADHKDKSLYELQLMVLDWIIAEEAKEPDAFTDKEHRELQRLRRKLVETKTPMLQGNYYVDDYE